MRIVYLNARGRWFHLCNPVIVNHIEDPGTLTMVEEWDKHHIYSQD